MSSSRPTYPAFLRLVGKRVLVVGAGPVATGKLAALLDAGAAVVVVAPRASETVRTLDASGELVWIRRAVEEVDLHDAWLVVAAAPADVNRMVGEWAQHRRCFVMAVDDVAVTDIFAPAVLERGGVRVALSSEGRAPALVGLLREALERVLPSDAELSEWLAIAQRARAAWKAQGLPLPERRRALLQQLLAHSEQERTSP